MTESELSPSVPAASSLDADGTSQLGHRRQGPRDARATPLRGRTGRIIAP